MIVLDTSTKKLEIVLAAAVAANQAQINCYFFDQWPQQQSAPASGHTSTLSNDTTDTTIVAATGVQGIRRNIHTISVFNRDTAAIIATIKIDDGGTERILVKQSLNAGDSLNYEHGAGWSFTTPTTAPFVDTLSLVKGSADSTKQIRIEVDGLTTATTRVITMPDYDVSLANIPTGTKMLFQQTSAPTGWSKDTTHNDKALRVVSGTVGNGGATAFTTVFGSGKSTGSYTLTTTDIPAHAHGAGTLTGTLNSRYDSGGATITSGDGNFAAESDSGDGDTSSTITFSMSGSTANAGGDGGHSHTLSLDLQYLDVIVATKA